MFSSNRYGYGQRTEEQPILKNLLTILITVALLIANNAIAREKSSYYRVAGIESDDHLNVRAEPSAAAEDIGDLAADSTPYEILEIDSTGTWGRILWLEGDGWVSLKYMQPIQIPLLADTQIPIGLTCVGAKPFWTLEFKSQQVGVISTQEEVKPMTVVNTTKSRNGKQFPIAVELQTNSNTATTTLRRAQCSDGMGGLRYEWAADVVINPQFTLLSGCCSLR